MKLNGRHPSTWKTVPVKTATLQATFSTITHQAPTKPARQQQQQQQCATSTREHRNNTHAEDRLQRAFDSGRTAWVEVFNTGTKRIGYAFKTTKPQRIGDAIKTTKPQRINVNPPNGVLGPKKRVRVAISCEAFDPGSEETEGDRVTVEWTNTPDSDANVFKPEWFQGDGMVRRMNLLIEYNI
ncbi:hypothetical protein niasHS_012519 [Heterodera schachtii]|uniref:Major sperm protein n=1 Tax=Heterodera schachtii TaxID=97005 RepID=A0ABD2I5F6_HETSC